MITIIKTIFLRKKKKGYWYIYLSYILQLCIIGQLSSPKFDRKKVFWYHFFCGFQPEILLPRNSIFFAFMGRIELLSLEQFNKKL